MFKLSLIEQHLDLVDLILQLNCTSSEFDKAKILADQKKGYWSLTDRLLKCHRQVAVLESLHTRLLTKAHCQIASAHPERGKTKKIIQACYYWYKMNNDIKQFVCNCYVCRHSTVLQDKTSGLLYLLLITDCL